MLLQDWWYTTLLGTSPRINPPLRGEASCDVLIVGGGAAGLAAALALKDSGRKVAIVERNILGGSSTGKSAGFLTPDSELELSQLLRRYGPAGARALWECATRGVEIMLAASRDHKVECDLQRQDSLFLGIGGSGAGQIEEEVAARKALGYPVRRYGKEELAEVIGSKAYRGAVRYGGTWGVNALRYAQGLKQPLIDAGVAVFESSEALRLDGHTLHTHLGSITADEVIFCADKMPQSLSDYYWNTYHAQTFLSISEPLSSAEVKAMFPEEPLQCWDSDLIYSYFRLTGDRRLLLGGGSLTTTYARNDTRTERVIANVVADFRRRWPVLSGVKFMQFWPGRIDMTRDLLPTVVRDPTAPHVHYVLGCVGLPWATFCGDFVARNVLGKAGADERKFYRYFREDRRFAVPLWLERVIGKRAAFSLNNAWAKYFQVDKGKRVDYEEGVF